MSSTYVLAVAVVEDLDGLACLQLLRGGEVEHIRAAGGTIHCEEAKAGGRDVIKFAVAVRQQFVRFFGGRVERDRVVDLVLHCEGHFFVATVNGRAGSVHEVLNACASVIIGMPAGFQDIVEPDEIALDIHVRMIDGIADARLCGEVDHDRGLVCPEDLVYKGFVSDAALHKNMPYRG